MPNIAYFMGGIYPGLPKQLFGSDSGSKGTQNKDARFSEEFFGVG